MNDFKFFAIFCIYARAENSKFPDDQCHILFFFPSQKGRFPELEMYIHFQF